MWYAMLLLVSLLLIFVVQFSKDLLQQTSLHIRDSQLFMRMAQLINKRRLQGPPTIQRLQCDNCGTCTQQKWNQHLIMHRALKSMRSLSIFVVRKQRYSRLNEKAQIKLSSTWNLLLDFVFMATTGPVFEVHLAKHTQF